MSSAQFIGTKRSAPLYSPSEATVIFVLGGPGAGKGTQCANLVRDYGFKHLSAGDLLREEQRRPGSDVGEMIKEYIQSGKIVPMEVTIQLLEEAMGRAMKEENKHQFLIDGFPREMDQGVRFESQVVSSRFTLFLDVKDRQTLLDRLLNRGKTSGRSDDNQESILKRFDTFKNQSMPVVKQYESEGKVEAIDAGDGTPNEVYSRVKERLSARGIKPSKDSA